MVRRRVGIQGSGLKGWWFVRRRSLLLYANGVSRFVLLWGWALLYHEWWRIGCGLCNPYHGEASLFVAGDILAWWEGLVA